MSFKFRTTFTYNNKLFWYPQHQTRAWNQLMKGIHHIDLVVEVRDARIPLTCINTFDSFTEREKLIIYNKSDLANPQMKLPLLKGLEKYRNEKNVLFTTASAGKNVDRILEFAIDKCKNDPIRFPYLSIVVVGAPNVGKSTLINGLRRLGIGKGKVTQVGKRAGVTTAIQTRVKINQDPPIYLFDTPGIFNPHVSSPIQGLKIALTGGTNDKLTTVINVADYLVFRLNNSPHRNTWFSVIGLSEPTDDVYHVAKHIAMDQEFILDPSSRIVRLSQASTISPAQTLEWDLDRACFHFIDLYREGKFGKMTLDDLSKDGIKAHFDQLDGVGQEQFTYSKTGYTIKSLDEK